MKIEPRCLNDDGVHYVTAQGHWMPCCAISMYRWYFDTPEFQVLNQSDFHKKQTFLDWLNKHTSSYDTAPRECKTRCVVYKDSEDEKNFYRSGDDAEFIYRKDSSS